MQHHPAHSDEHPRLVLLRSQVLGLPVEDHYRAP